MSTSKKAVIDRFEGDKAVLLVNEKPVVVLKKALPAKAKEGDWLVVEFEGEHLVSTKADASETERMRVRIEDKMARLRARKKTV